MKHLFAIIFCSSFLSPLTGQTFAPIGTKWGFNYNAQSFGGSFYLESVEDTIIQGKNCRKLKYEDVFHDYISRTDTKYKGFSYLYENNDSLFSITRDSAKLDLIFSYKLKVGDTLTLSYFNTQKLRNVVTNLSDTLISGQKLKAWTLKAICTQSSFSGKWIFIEKIGALNGVLKTGFTCASDYTYYDLCVFSAGNIYLNGKYSCTYTATADLTEKITLNVYPNPTKSGLNIETDHLFTSYQISDLSGKIIQKGILNDSSINISGLFNGIYLLQLTDRANNTAHRKIVKSF